MLKCTVWKNINYRTYKHRIYINLLCIYRCPQYQTIYINLLCIYRCPQYPAIPSFCSFTKVPGQCCPSLHCNSPTFGNYNPLPQLVPTPRPNVTPTPGNPNLIVQPQPGTGTSGQNPIVVSPGTSQTSFTGNTDSKSLFHHS